MEPKIKRISISVLLVFLFLPGVFGQDSEKKLYKATQISTPPVINGTLDDEAWKSGTWAGDFIQNQPYSGKPESQRTEFKILFDDNNIYVAIKAYDTSPDSIVNRLTRRDEVDGDLVAIIVDSFHDLRTGFLFGVSSTGVKYDQMITNDGQNSDSSWDPNWWVETSINKEGWVAEMKIPFSQVRFEKNSGKPWGLEMARILYRKNETTFWQNIPRDAPGLVHMFGELQGLEQIKPRKIFDVTPYGVVKAETFQSVPENPFLAKGKSSKLNGGIDAKIGLTNNMTMDLTINPDFGQVESDPSVVNLTAYESFFSEKRPFFIEGNNITDFGLGIGNGSGNDNLFYSRRIGRPPQGYPNLKYGWSTSVPNSTNILGAAKITGKSKDGLSVGFVEAITAEEKAEIDTLGGRKYETVEPLTNYFVGRVQKDIKNGNTIIGGMFTSTNRVLDDNLNNFMHKSAYTGGVDLTQYFNNKNWMFSINAAFSLVEGSKKAITNTQESSVHFFQRPDKNYAVLDTNRTSLSGSGGKMQIMKLNGHWSFMNITVWKTPGFETNDLGYIREADQILDILGCGYHQWEPKWIYKSFNINTDVYSISNFGGNWVGKGYEFNAFMNLKNYWNIWTGFNLNSESLSSGMLRGGPMMKLPGFMFAQIGIYTDYRKKLVFSVSASRSNGYENNSMNLTSGMDITYKPINSLSFTVSPAFSKSFEELQYVTQIKYYNSDRYIFASIDQKTISTSFRVNLNLSPNLTFQYWGQPFIASGKYYNYKFILDPMASSYKNRFLTYSPRQIISDGDHYNVDENGNGATDYSFNKIDFNVREFLSNLVIRWEYSPGSSVYLVWSQTRSSSNSSGNLDLFSDMGNLFNTRDNKPHNVFLIKFSYRFGIK